MQLQVNDVLDFALKLAEAMDIPVPDHSKIFIDFLRIPDAVVNWGQPVRIHWEIDPKAIDLQQDGPEIPLNWRPEGVTVGTHRDVEYVDLGDGILSRRPFPGIDFVLNFIPLPIDDLPSDSEELKALRAYKEDMSNREPVAYAFQEYVFDWGSGRHIWRDQVALIDPRNRYRKVRNVTALGAIPEISQ